LRLLRVVTDSRYVRQGKRVLDRPKYYVQSVLNVEEDGTKLQGMPSPSGGTGVGDIGAGISTMMVYSEDDDVERALASTAPGQPQL